MRGGRSLFATCCALAALIAGCGGGEEADSSGAAAQAAARTAQAEPTRTETTQTQPQRPRWDMHDPNIDIHTGRRLAPNPWREPRSIELRPGNRITHVVARDVEVGRGRGRVRAGDWVFMDFIEATYRTGRVFMRGWKHHRPWGTAGKILSPHSDIRGLLRGMEGMRPGGRRQIIVPARISGGIDSDHPDYRRTTYWDVVFRGFYARGCKPEGEPCRSGP